MDWPKGKTFGELTPEQQAAVDKELAVLVRKQLRERLLLQEKWWTQYVMGVNVNN